jgi:hypothetical protein
MLYKFEYMDEMMLAISNLDPKPKRVWNDFLLKEMDGCHFSRIVIKMRFNVELQMD